MKTKKRKKTRRTKKKPVLFGGYDVSNLRPQCWQCDLDIRHVCFDGLQGAKWGQES